MARIYMNRIPVWDIELSVGVLRDLVYTKPGEYRVRRNVDLSKWTWLLTTFSDVFDNENLSILVPLLRFKECPASKSIKIILFGEVLHTYNIIQMTFSGLR